MSGNPRPAKSYTGGEKSSLPLNHGFTVCWSDETTSVRWPGMSERTWLASTCPESASSPARLKASRQLPTATVASEAASASQRVATAGRLRRTRVVPAASRSVARTRSRSASGARRAGTCFRIAALRATRASWRRAQSPHPLRCASSSRCVTLLPFLSVAQCLLKPPARPRQPRHDRTDWDAGYVADLFVGQPLELAQHDHLPEFRAEPIERLVQRLARRVAVECRCRSVLRQGVAVQLFIELRRERVAAVPAPPGVRGVAHDRQQPRAAVAGTALSPEAAEVLERTQVGVLHDVLRVVVITREVARQRVSGVQVRQHDRFESLQLARLQAVLDVVAVRLRVWTPGAAG